MELGQVKQWTKKAQQRTEVARKYGGRAIRKMP